MTVGFSPNKASRTLKTGWSQWLEVAENPGGLNGSMQHSAQTHMH
jgi:hypothetical protein